MTSNRYNLAQSLLRPAIGPKKFENLVNLIKKPYSRWEIEFNCIFIHVPKVAGKAIAKSLLGAPNGTTLSSYLKMTTLIVLLRKTR